MIPTDYTPLQVRYAVDPLTKEVNGWKVLVICILLNRTSRGQVEDVLDEFFAVFPDAHYAARAGRYHEEHVTMEEVLAPLGFQHTRTRRIAFMSKEWVDHEDWRTLDRVKLFAGCGQYAVDAWRIFVDHDYSRPAGDGVLETWRARMVTP